MFCKKCGNEITDGERFCTSCGEPVREAVAGAQEKEAELRRDKELMFDNR